VRRFLALAVALGLIYAVALAVPSTYTWVSIAGTATVGGNYNMVMDSTDTAYVDTFNSDTVDVTEGMHMNIGLWYTDATLSDSCNDSLVVIVQTWTSFNDLAKKLIFTDTFFDSNAIATPLPLVTYNFKTDTMVYNKLWFTTIAKDSCITTRTTPDTNVIKMKYQVLQRPYGSDIW